MRFIFRLLSCLCAALAIGIGSAWYMVSSGSMLTVKNIGPWSTWLQAGNMDADPYTKAHFARSGELPVTSTSTRSFVAKTDSEGNKLHGDCEYVITGKPIALAWWGLAVYDSNGNIIRNKARRYAFNKHNLFYREDGSYEITLAPEARAGNWLPNGGASSIQIVMRLYQNKTDSLLSDMKALQELMPQIKKVDC